MQTVSYVSLGNCNKEYPSNETNAGVDDSTTMFAHVFISFSNTTLVLNGRCEWKRKNCLKIVTKLCNQMNNKENHLKNVKCTRRKQIYFTTCKIFSTLIKLAILIELPKIEFCRIIRILF